MELQIGVKALLRNPNGDYLLLKRATPLQDGTLSWDIPGGRIHPHEPVLTALAREIKEETGITLNTNNARVINCQDIFVTAKNIHVVRLTYILNVPDVKITLSAEHSEFKFCTIAEAKACVTEPQFKETLEKL